MIIYKTTNLVNNKIYIGQTKTNHSDYLGSGDLISKAVKKYGIHNFKREILEECKTKEELDTREKYWITLYNSTDKTIGYNLMEGGQGGENNTLDSFIRKYGKEDGIRKFNECWSSMSKNRKGIPGFRRNLQGFISKYGLEEGTKRYYNSNTGIEGFIFRYGEETGRRLFNEMQILRGNSQKLALSSEKSKNTIGGFKLRYGDEEGTNKYNNYVERKQIAILGDRNPKRKDKYLYENKI